MRKQISPCVENKCLKFPMCKQKIRIDCPELHEYFTWLFSKHTHQHVWKILQDDLPKLYSVDRISVLRFGEYEL